MSDFSGWLASALMLGYFVTVILILFRLILKRRKVGVTLAWIGVIFAVPILGVFAYLVFGELELGRFRAKRARRLNKSYRAWLDSMVELIPATEQRLNPKQQGVAKLIFSREGMPLLPGNAAKLFTDAGPVFDGLIADINDAEHSVWMEFYILEEHGRVEPVLQSLEQAAARGVQVFIALDSAGSSDFIGSERQLQLERNGVKVLELLPVLPWRLWLERQDLRVHRKAVVVDGQVGWTGSMNLVDPVLFNEGAGVGEWVDSMLRIEGPAALFLKSVVVNDWQLETGRNLLPRLRQSELPSPSGSVLCQVAPSGPASPDDSIEEVLLTAIYAAQSCVRMTTPYFVPGEGLVTALKAAVHRGVDVTLIVPKRNDSRLVGLASSSYYEELLAAGVCIEVFDGGLLHAKLVVIDDDLALYGSVNLDMRSFWLNFELTVAIYHSDTVHQLHQLIDQYQNDTRALSLDRWRKRGLATKLLQQLAYLCSPLL